MGTERSPHTLILPCAGLSTRFGGVPKWSLTHPSGNIMAAEAVRGLTGWTRLIVGLNSDDAERFGVDNVATEFWQAGIRPEAEVFAVGRTRHQVETACRLVEMASVDDNMPITVKDCDNFFRHELQARNMVSVVDLHDAGRVMASNKSYVVCAGERSRTVNYIAENQIVSSLFCCGAYTFERCHEFKAHAKRHTHLSAVISDAVRHQIHFTVVRAEGYVDWGTAEDWAAFKQRYMTIFVDIDGTLVGSGHRSFEPRWGETEPIRENVAALNALHDPGSLTSTVEIVLTTSRPERMREATERQLAEVGLRYDRLIMGLRVCPRYLINDAKPGEASCFAVTLERNSPSLASLLARTGVRMPQTGLR